MNVTNLFVPSTRPGVGGGFLVGNRGVVAMGGGGGAGGAGGGVAPGSSQSAPGVIPEMMGVYKELLGINQQHYGNVMNAYQSGQNTLARQLPGIYQGYGQLSGDVMNTLGMGQVLGQNGNWGVAGPAAQAIKDQFEQMRGQTTQDLTSRGLGNTTAVSNAQNQNALFAAKAYGGLGAQLAQTAAGFQSQIGMGGLGAQMQGLGLQTGLTQSALGPLGQQFSNTAGSLTGQYSASQAYAPSGHGYSGMGGGYGGGGVGRPIVIQQQPQQSAWRPDPYVGPTFAPAAPRPGNQMKYTHGNASPGSYGGV